MLPADQRALVDGRMPRTLLQYREISVPPALATGEGITAATVASREASRQSTADANALKADQKKSHESEIRLALFQSIYSALKPNAPLLVKKLEARCKQDDFPTVHDGVKAWKMLVDMSASDAQLPGEAANYDAKLLALELKPLSDDATPDEFAARVSDAIDNTFPYLKRKYSTPEEIGEWVLSQVPERHGAECRTGVRALTDDEKRDPHKVAATCVDIIATARPVRTMHDAKSPGRWARVSPLGTVGGCRASAGTLGRLFPEFEARKGPG